MRFILLALAASTAGPALAAERIPVLVELFTSEGCSSCPPADAELIALETEAPIEGVEIIPLSLHVDYWNRLGWKDPFSAPAFSQRQEEYGEKLSGGRIYTPQLVVDGRVELVGSSSRVREVVRAAARSSQRSRTRLSVQGTRAGSAIEVTVWPAAPLPEGSDLFVALTERGLETKVRAGENAGRTIAHTGVVRRLERIAPANGAARARISLDPSWRSDRLAIVAFAQARASREILGAATAVVR